MDDVPWKRDGTEYVEVKRLKKQEIFTSEMQPDFSIKQVSNKYFELTWRGTHSKKFTVAQIEAITEDRSRIRDLRYFLVHFLDRRAGY